MVVALLRQQHQIESLRRIGASLHRLKARLLIPIRKGNNRVVVREIIVDGELEVNIRAADILPEQLILRAVAHREKNLRPIFDLSPGAIENVDAHQTLRWVNSGAMEIGI